VLDPLDPLGGVLGPPPLGVVDAPPVALAGEPVLGWTDGVVDGFLLPVADCGLVAPAEAVAVGRTAPLAGDDTRDAPDGAGLGTWPAVAALVAEFPAGVWFAAGAPPSTPEANSATSPALITRATPAPSARPFARFRWSPGRWPPG